MPNVSYVYGPYRSGKSLKLLKLRNNDNKNAYIITYSEMAAKELKEKAERFDLCSNNIISISALTKHLPNMPLTSTLYIDDMETCFAHLLRRYIENNSDCSLPYIPSLCCAITQMSSDIHLENATDTIVTEEREISGKCELKLEAPPTINISGGDVTILFPPTWE